MQPFDIAICGAGPVGQTLALLLIKRGLPSTHIALIDAKTKEEASKDQRTIALSYGSRQILESVGAWPIKATEIHQIHVSQRGHFGRTLIDRAEQRVPALGYVARYNEILKSLENAFDHRVQGLHFLRPARISHITQTESAAHLHLDDQTILTASIVVQAEGGMFHEQAAQTIPNGIQERDFWNGLMGCNARRKLQRYPTVSREWATPQRAHQAFSKMGFLNSVEYRHHDYQQTALIAHVKTTLPVAFRAFERFTQQGPLALLPDEDGYALVWCVAPEQAAHLMNLDEAVFLSRLQMTFGTRLGQFISSTPRYAFPLGLNAQISPPVGRCVSIGNAAQTLHPVAGQGLNLGLRDAWQVAQLLSKSLNPDVLQDFFKARYADRNRTIHLTDQLAQLFISSSESSVKQNLLGAGLGLLDVLQPAQRWLAEQMMFGRRG